MRQIKKHKIMRTTISLSSEIYDLIAKYAEHFQFKLGPRISVSSVIEEAIGISFPIMFDRIQKEGQTLKEFLDQRASDIEYKLSFNVNRAEILAIMREATYYQNSCANFFLKDQSTDQIAEYQEYMLKFLFAYQIGVNKLKEIKSL